MMKHCVILLLVCSVVGCSTIEHKYQPTVQVRDLNDTDQDGVVNVRDRCKKTPRSAVVNNDGCPIYKKYSQKLQVQILFDHDSTMIARHFMPEIERIAQFMDQYPDVYLQLEGHASTKGEKSYNRTLSQMRAKRVKKQLLKKGIKSKRIRIVGFGDLQPLSAADEEEGHRRSRRVYASLIAAEGNVVEEWTIFNSQYMNGKN